MSDRNPAPPNLHVSRHPAVLHKLAILRDQATEPKKFREVVRELSWLLGYEALADARLRPLRVRTPLEETDAHELGDRIGLVPILRAGLGMVDAMLELMPTAQVWHLGLFRDERTLRPVEYYNKLPDSATVELCLILDPMLATGGSATAAIDVLKRWGASRIKLINLIAAPEGVAAVSAAHPDVDDPLRGPRPRPQRQGLHPARPRRRRRPPVRDRAEGLTAGERIRGSRRGPAAPSASAPLDRPFGASQKCGMALAGGRMQTDARRTEPHQTGGPPAHGLGAVVPTHRASKEASRWRCTPCPRSARSRARWRGPASLP